MKTIVLDRDGVINYDSDQYIKSPDEFHMIPRSGEAIALLKQQGYRVVVASNQSGIARGYYTEAILSDIHAKMLTLARAAGGNIDHIEFCPHHPDDNCDCRKPKPGMLTKIEQHLKISLATCVFVGDKLSDVAAAQAVNMQPILVNTGLKQHTPSKEIPLYEDLYRAVTLAIL